MKFKRQLMFGIFAAAVCVAAFFVGGRNLPASVEAAKKEDCIRLPVIMYHQVLDNPSKLGKFVISPKELEHDMRIISERGFETVTISDLIYFCRGERDLPKKPIMLTFDDGYETDYVNVLPLLRKYNMRAVFSVVGSYAEKYSEDIHKHINYAYLSWDEMAEMLGSGLCEFQNHSYNLHSLDKRRGCLRANGESELDYSRILLKDLELSQKLFKEKLGISPLCFTYPFGLTSSVTDNLVRGYTFSATLGTEEKINLLSGSPDELYNLYRFNRPHGMDISKILDKAEKTD